jgi:ABC-type glycerol-3-phosphate transport system permease component
VSNAQLATAPVEQVRPQAGKSRAAELAWYVLWLVVVSLAAVLFILPFLWMLSSSLKQQAQIFIFPPSLIPSPVEWQNYAQVWQVQPTLLFFKNTLFIVVMAVLGDLISSSMVAFAFARLRFRGRDLLFIVLLSTIMLPSHVTLIPHFLLFSWLGWVNTHAPLIVPYWFGNPLHVFLLRQFMMGIPDQLDDAAKMDGASYWDMYTRIIMPLAMPALGVVAMFSITQHWNEFTQPLIYLSSKELFTLAIGVRTFQTELGIQQMHLLMAMSTITLLPLVILFFVGQKLFIRGISLQGIH